MATTVPIGTSKTKVIYSLNLNNYDKGHKPYYPSMDPNAMGGELKIKSKRQIKSEDRNRINSLEPGKEKDYGNNKKQNSLAQLISAYQEDEG